MDVKNQVFLSYSGVDQDAAQRLASALRKAGLEVFFAQHQITGGQGVSEAVRREVRAAKAFIALMTDAYCKSVNCYWEFVEFYTSVAREPVDQHRMLIVNIGDAEKSAFDTPQREISFLADRLYFRIDDHATDPERADNETAIEIARCVSALPNVTAQRDLANEPLLGFDSYRHFVGRLREKLLIESVLRAYEFPMSRDPGRRGADRKVLVYGGPGIGKSLLVKQFCREFCRRYSGGIHWLDAYPFQADPIRKDPKDPIAQPTPANLERKRLENLKQVARSLDLAATSNDADGLLDSIQKHIDQRGERVLWIIDDYPEGFSDEFARWTPRSNLVHTIVLSRGRDLVMLSPIELEPLSKADSLELLHSRLERRTGDPGPSNEEMEAAEDLAAFVGFHPLALDVAGALVGSDRFSGSFAKLLDQMNQPDDAESDEQVMLLATDAIGGFGGIPSNTQRNIARVVLRSIRQSTPQAQDFLRIAALLAARPIPELLFRNIARESSPLLGKTDPQSWFEQAARECADRALAQGIRDGGEASWTIHSIVSRACRLGETQSERVKQLRATTSEAVRATLSPLFREHRERPDLLAALAHGRKLAMDARVLQDIPLGSIVVSYDFNVQGTFGNAVLVLRPQIELRTRLLGPSHHATIAAKANLAHALQQIGEFDESRALSAAVRSAPNLDSAEAIIAAEHQAILLRTSGDPRAAARQQAEVLERAEATLGPDHPVSVRCRVNLKQTLVSIGEYEAADPLTNSPATDEILQLDLREADAQSLFERGRYAEAIRLQNLILDRRIALQGEQAHSTLIATNNFGTMLIKIGQYELGVDRLRFAIKHYRERLADPTFGRTRDEPGVYRWMINLAAGERGLAITAQQRGNPADFGTQLAAAERTLRDAYAGLARALGEQHPDSLTAQYELGELIRATGGPARIQEAMQLLERTVSGLTKCVGDSDARTLRALSALAIANTALGRAGRTPEDQCKHFLAASKLQERALLGFEKLHGRHVESTTASAWSLCVISRMLGDNEKASTLFREHLEWLLTAPPATLTPALAGLRQQLEVAS